MDAYRPLRGGCQCGAVRYRLDVPPTGGNICHCRMCQKAGGGPFMAFAGVPADKFTITRGEITAFVSSEIAERGFCPKCGTPLTYRGNGSGRVSVALGSLDDPNAVTPDTQLGGESEVHWLAAALKAPKTSTEQWLAKRNRADAGSRQHPDRD
jgi:hypothetical protein